MLKNNILKRKTLLAFLIFSILLTFCFNLVSCSEDTSGSMNETSTSGNQSSASNAGNSESGSQSNGHNHNENVDFVFDVTAVPSETEKGIINAVITLSHIHCDLSAVQFKLTFTSNTAEAIYKTNDEMKNSMTVVPTYKTTVGVDVPSFEQICTYNESKSLYECMFVDLLSYPMAEENQTIKPITKAGDLVITIPFKVKSDASVGSVIAFDFIEGSVSGTKTSTFTGAVGAGNGASYTLTEKDLAK